MPVTIPRTLAATFMGGPKDGKTLQVAEAREVIEVWEDPLIPVSEGWRASVPVSRHTYYLSARDGGALLYTSGAYREFRHGAGNEMPVDEPDPDGFWSDFIRRRDAELAAILPALPPGWRWSVEEREPEGRRRMWDIIPRHE